MTYRDRPHPMQLLVSPPYLPTRLRADRLDAGHIFEVFGKKGWQFTRDVSETYGPVSKLRAFLGVCAAHAIRVVVLTLMGVTGAYVACP